MARTDYLSGDGPGFRRLRAFVAELEHERPGARLLRVADVLMGDCLDLLEDVRRTAGLEDQETRPTLTVIRGGRDG